MKIIIAGGAGFVGKNLVRVMIEEEKINPKNITVIDKNDKGFSHIEKYAVKLVKADVSYDGAWSDEFKKADILINLAAQISSNDEHDFIQNNVVATKKLVEACKKHNVKKIIHFSSASVLSVRKDHYANTKKASETIIISSKIKHVILRPSLMFGLLDDKNVGWLINFARLCPIFPIPGNGKYPRQPIYVDDMCHLVIKLTKKFPAGKIYSINGREIVYFGDMIGIVLKNMKGIHIALKIPIPLFKFAMKVYEKIPFAKFTSDQVDSLVSGDVFPNYAWWDEYGIKMTPYEVGAKLMLKERGVLKTRH